MTILPYQYMIREGLITRQRGLSYKILQSGFVD